MTEYEALRREIEVRLWRETIFKAVAAHAGTGLLAEEIAKNDQHLAWIGDYMRSMGSTWEQVYANNKKKAQE